MRFGLLGSPIGTGAARLQFSLKTSRRLHRSTRAACQRGIPRPVTQLRSATGHRENTGGIEGCRVIRLLFHVGFCKKIVDKTVHKKIFNMNAKTGTIRNVDAAEKPTRAAVIYDALRHAILSRKLLPGAKLTEEDIAAVYDVSRTLVRSALQSLEHDGLAELKPRRGAFVSRPSKQEAREVFDARLLIEPVVAGLAAQNATDDDIRALKESLEAERQAVERGEDAKAVLLSGAFHSQIAKIARHNVYATYVERLCTRSALIIGQYWRERSSLCECSAHDDLVDAIAGHRSEDASHIMEHHLKDILGGVSVDQMEDPHNSLAGILHSLKEETGETAAP